MSPYEKATDAFAAGDFGAAVEIFERIARDLPEVWLPVLRCREALRDQQGARIARRKLEFAADSGNPAASFAYHLLTRETGNPFASQTDIELSRKYLRRAAEAGYGPAVEQMRVDQNSGLY